MRSDADIAVGAGLIADATRACFLGALGDGRALPASELAALAAVTRATASVHLSKLTEAGLLTVERHGRHRYFRLAGSEVAEALEAIAAISPQVPVRTLRAATRGELLHFARMCYDHLAGQLGVAITSALLGDDVLARDGDRYAVTDHGARRLGEFGIDLEPLRRGRRTLARPCLDWTMRRHHLAGALGAALATRFDECNWTQRQPGRVVRLTDLGRRSLNEMFGLDLRDDTRGYGGTNGS